MELNARFESRVSPEPMSGCHLWTGGMLPNGYGMFWVPEASRNVGAHRIAYEAAHGPIRDGQVIDHLCHNRACVNPAHLRATDTRGNASNLEGKSRGKFSSRFTGVAWNKAWKKWTAQIYLNGRLKHLGAFVSESEAAEAYAECLELVEAMQQPNTDGRANTGVS